MAKKKRRKLKKNVKQALWLFALLACALIFIMIGTHRRHNIQANQEAITTAKVATKKIRQLKIRLNKQSKKS